MSEFMMASELVAILQARIAEDGDMPVFTYDMHGGTVPGQQYQEPEPEKVKLYPGIRRGEKSLFGESTWGQMWLNDKDTKPDGEPFYAILL